MGLSEAGKLGHGLLTSLGILNTTISLVLKDTTATPDLFNASTVPTDVNESEPQIPCAGEFIKQSVTSNIGVKMILLLIITPIICTMGIVGNIFAFVTFFHNKHRYRGNAAFLMGLCVFDTGVLLLTIAIYTVEVLWGYFDSVELYYAWMNYLRAAYYTSHVFQITAVYLTVLATIEQYLSVRLAGKAAGATVIINKNTKKVPKTAASRRRSSVPIHSMSRFCCACCSQPAIMLGTILAIALFCLPKLMQIYVQTVAHCTGYGRYMVGLSEFGESFFYRTVYDMWLMNLFTVFIPFLLILVFNILVAKRFAHSRKKESGLLIIIVATIFLICNAPALVLTTIEYINVAYLNQNMFLYTLLRDIANIFVTLNSAVNFYAYLIMGLEFRKQFRSAIMNRAPWMASTIRLLSVPMQLGEGVCRGPLGVNCGEKEVSTMSPAYMAVNHQKPTAVEQTIRWIRGSIHYQGDSEDAKLCYDTILTNKAATCTNGKTEVFSEPGVSADGDRRFSLMRQTASDIVTGYNEKDDTVSTQIARPKCAECNDHICKSSCSQYSRHCINTGKIRDGKNGSSSFPEDIIETLL